MVRIIASKLLQSIITEIDNNTVAKVHRNVLVVTVSHALDICFFILSCGRM